MSEHKIRVGITQGDINGIGLEIVLKTLHDPLLSEICTPVLFSSQKTVGYFKKMIGLDDLNVQFVREWNQLNPKKANVFVCYEEEVQIELGKATPVGGKYAFLSLEKATTAVKEGQVDTLITAPINKHAIHSESFPFAGHTEYLAQQFASGQQEALMLMCADNLRIGVVTGHIPVAEVAKAISKESIIKKLHILNTCLKKDFGIQKPKIAVLGLNPHAGDKGVIGREELDIIQPAIDACKEQMLVYGSYPADGFFGNETYTKFDAVLAMYHDQGLIPFKTLSFQNGVNYTAGLEVVRTSPDHGTGYDIAGKNIASADSFRKSIYMAIDIYRRRKLHEEVSQNPLPFGNLKKER